MNLYAVCPLIPIPVSWIAKSSLVHDGLARHLCKLNIILLTVTESERAGGKNGFLHRRLILECRGRELLVWAVPTFARAAFIASNPGVFFIVFCDHVLYHSVLPRIRSMELAFQRIINWVNHDRIVARWSKNLEGTCCADWRRRNRINWNLSLMACLMLVDCSTTDWWLCNGTMVELALNGRIDSFDDDSICAMSKILKHIAFCGWYRASNHNCCSNQRVWQICH